MKNTRNMKFRPFLAVVTLASAAGACPFCHTQTGEQIHASVFGPDFWFNVGVTLLPFAIFLGLTALIYFGVPTHQPSVEDSACLPRNGKETV